MVYNEKTGKDGAKTTTEITAVYRLVNIYADDGTPIKAQILDHYEKTIEVTGKDGTVLSKTTDNHASYKAADPGKNCHGYSMAKGAVWIDNDEAGKLLEHDYVQTKESNATVVMFATYDYTGGGPEKYLDPNGHSAKRNGNGSYNYDSGSDFPKANVTKEAAKGIFNVKKETFYKKKEKDKVIDGSKGDTKTYKGVNITAKEG